MSLAYARGQSSIRRWRSFSIIRPAMTPIMTFLPNRAPIRKAGNGSSLRVDHISTYARPRENASGASHLSARMTASHSTSMGGHLAAACLRVCSQSTSGRERSRGQRHVRALRRPRRVRRRRWRRFRTCRRGPSRQSCAHNRCFSTLFCSRNVEGSPLFQHVVADAEQDAVGRDDAVVDPPREAPVWVDACGGCGFPRLLENF